MTISYFDKSKTGGEQTPIYAITFELYENGISRALMLDYNDFVVTGEMTSLEIGEATSEALSRHQPADDVSRPDQLKLRYVPQHPSPNASPLTTASWPNLPRTRSTARSAAALRVPDGSIRSAGSAALSSHSAVTPMPIRR